VGGELPAHGVKQHLRAEERARRFSDLHQLTQDMNYGQNQKTLVL
jgi:hypothetical protein